MNKQNQSLIIATIFIILITVFAPKFLELTGKVTLGEKDASCDNIGDRDNEAQLYCNIDYTVQVQKIEGVDCINNFECISNVCQEGICKPGLEFGTQGDTPPPLPPSGGSGPGSSGSSGGSSSRWRGAAGICISNWTCTTWSACIGGKKTRECIDINKCEREPPIYDKPAEEMLCMLIAIPTCSDGILNQNEEGVDCGGPCELCKTCFDNEQNCHDGDCEEGVDCGGPCMPCKHVIPIMLVIITSFLVIVLIILGIWYWRIKRSAEQFIKRPPLEHF